MLHTPVSRLPRIVKAKGRQFLLQFQRPKEFLQPALPPADRAVFEPVSAVDLPALHDAAIVNWQTADLPGDSIAVAIARVGSPRATRQQVLADLPLSASGEEFNAVELIATSLSENKQVVAALMAAIALNFVWSYNRPTCEEPSVRVTKSKPRKLAERLHAAER